MTMSLFEPQLYHYPDEYCNHPRLRNDLYCDEWDVKLYYIIPYCNH